jgi:hypothetical protein
VTGRCAGCGRTDKNADVVREHTRQCPQYAAVYAADPALALDPADEFARWAAEDRPEVRAARKSAAVAEADRRRAEQANRWRTPPDILGED